MITLKEFTNQIEAGILQSFLADNQIEAVLADENASAWSPSRTVVPIRLQVRDDQVEAAIGMIKKFEDSPIISQPENTQSKRRSRTRRWS